jgi:hypothetical protein
MMLVSFEQNPQNWEKLSYGYSKGSKFYAWFFISKVTKVKHLMCFSHYGRERGLIDWGSVKF